MTVCNTLYKFKKVGLVKWMQGNLSRKVLRFLDMCHCTESLLCQWLPASGRITPDVYRVVPKAANFPIPS